jgi:phosphate transport system permease protein
MTSLPLFIFTSYQTHQPLALTRAFGAASVLLAMVLLLFVVARWIVRDKSGRPGSRLLVVQRFFIRDVDDPAEER